MSTALLNSAKTVDYDSLSSFPENRYLYCRVKLVLFLSQPVFRKLLNSVRSVTILWWNNYSVSQNAFFLDVQLYLWNTFINIYNTRLQVGIKIFFFTSCSPLYAKKGYFILSSSLFKHLNIKTTEWSTVTVRGMLFFMYSQKLTPGWQICQKGYSDNQIISCNIVLCIFDLPNQNVPFTRYAMYLLFKTYKILCFVISYIAYYILIDSWSTYYK